MRKAFLAHKKFSKGYVTTEVCQKDQFGLVEKGRHWALKVWDVHERASGRPIERVAQNAGPVSNPVASCDTAFVHKRPP